MAQQEEILLTLSDVLNEVRSVKEENSKLKEMLESGQQKFDPRIRG